MAGRTSLHRAGKPQMVASLHTVCIPAYTATSQGLQDLAALLTAISGSMVRMSRLYAAPHGAQAWCS